MILHTFGCNKLQCISAKIRIYLYCIKETARVLLHQQNPHGLLIKHFDKKIFLFTMNLIIFCYKISIRSGFIEMSQFFFAFLLKKCKLTQRDYTKIMTVKVPFTDCYTWQKFRLWFLRLLVNNCIESIYKTQKL